MNSKTFLICSIVVLTFIMIFSSCKKYEEGPSVSLRSPENRISGNWILSYTKINDTLVDPAEITWLIPELDSSLVADIGGFAGDVWVYSTYFNFEKDGDGMFEYLIFNYSQLKRSFFSWALDSNKENILINYNDENFELKIIRLTNKEMTLKRTQTGDGTFTTTELEFLRFNPDDTGSEN